MSTEGTRRAFVGGAVATGAVIGGMALFGRSGDPTIAPDGVRVVAGRNTPPAILFDPVEVDRWTALVGKPVRIAGEQGYTSGTVESVQRVRSDGPRPAGVRKEGFTVTFVVDAATAPVGDAIYDIGHTIEGLSRLFLIRAADRGKNAVFFAFFN
ncbi:MAG: hypothetical protein JWN21_1654 [Sphingomonas bacterium]|uniref:DUF6916 family protein n=1 Tax=Sphingomonas bacterium TaxID=1895847 RepID=UPI002601F564|nr:hypothetical protein [Sphingomonas bacterium]MDB5696111.1 hypothetical protein [Sphingomonas bacterium]